MKRLLFLLLALASLPIFDTESLAIDDERLAKIKNVGVISLIGSELCLNYRKTLINPPLPDLSTIKTNPEAVGLSMRVFTPDITSWAFAASAQREIQTILQCDGKYILKDLSAYRESFKKILPDGYRACWGRKEYDLYAIRNTLGEVKRKFGVDTVIIVLDSLMHTMNESTDHLHANGLYRAPMPTGFLRSELKTFAYSGIRLVVVDTANFEEIAAAFGKTFQTVDNKHMDTYFDNWSVADQILFAENMRVLVRSSVRKGLRELGLLK